MIIVFDKRSLQVFRDNWLKLRDNRIYKIGNVLIVEYTYIYIYISIYQSLFTLAGSKQYRILFWLFLIVYIMKHLINMLLTSLSPSTHECTFENTTIALVLWQLCKSFSLLSIYLSPSSVNA